MVYPAFTIVGTQIGMILLLLFFFHNRNYMLNFNSNISSWFALFFILACIISVIDSNQPNQKDDLSLLVLPNYIMWGLTILFLPQLLRKMNFYHIYKGICYGTIALVISNIIPQLILKLFPFFRFPVDNGFAFMLITFSPITFYYLQTHNKTLFYLFALIALSTLITLGRRAGFVLVGTQFILFHFIGKLNSKNILRILIILITSTIVVTSETFEQIIQTNSERLYQLIYQYEETKLTDQSALTRKAMVEKGLIIFNQHPLTGIGLNNFMNFDIDIPLLFEGGDVLAYKDLSEKSSHNSYIEILAGGGILLLGPLLLFFAMIFSLLIQKLKGNEDHFKIVLLGFGGMCIHLYFITAIVNIFTWYYIAIAFTISNFKELSYSNPKLGNKKKNS